MTNEELRKELEEVLKCWLHQYAGEFCYEEDVETYENIILDSGGTLAYITSKFEKLRED